MKARRPRRDIWSTGIALAALTIGPQTRSVQTTDSGTWGLDRIDQTSSTPDSAYHYTQTGAGVSIYVIDTGIRASHKDFGGRVVSVGDFCSADARGNPASTNSDDIDPGPGHGTLNASIAAGATSGVAKGAAVYALRAFCRTSSGWHGTSESIRNAVEWITAHGHKPAVVNISFGPGWPDRSINNGLKAAILSSIDAGFVYVLSQACQPDVDKLWSRDVATRALVAGSVDTGDVAAGRNYGADLAMFAPAPGVVGATKASDASYDDYGQVDNHCADSHAAPHVAGVAARYLELHPSATPATVRAELVNHATTGALSNVHSGTPNRLLYSGFLDGPLRRPAPIK